MKTLIKNATIVTSENEYTGDILTGDGTILQIGDGLEVEADKVIDATGKYVLPGGVDQHVHFSFNFFGEQVRGFETSNAAALGGTTTLIEFVNQVKDKGLVDSIEDYRRENVDGIAMVDYSFHSVMTDPRDEVIEEIPMLAEAGYPTMKLFMAYKGMFFHADDDAILKALMEGKKAGITVMVHAENADAIDVLQKNCVAKGDTSPYYHAVSRPPVVEAEATKRAIYLAELAGAPLYVVHVSCKEALDEITLARGKGQPVCGETCSHYLTLDIENLAKPNFEGAKYVCSPALRTSDQFDELWRGLNNGDLNSISSDHCGFNWSKQKHMGIDDFRMIPNGAPGLENRLEVLWTYGVEEGKISRQKLVDLFATTPAKNNGIDYCKGHISIGYDADLVIFDPSYKGYFTNEGSLQGVDYCSYEGMPKKGKVETVLLRGEVVVENGEYIGTQGQGKLIKGKPFGLMYK